ncbi:hypothetical protein [Candidatus Uabimicrobium sp. HlEnr_7]|uniref:hypothetical protein n=1 Tax=Candidatus Uabimicrobium helgolandensis TaxID=3095367 RepID=UPI003558D82D
MRVLIFILCVPFIFSSPKENITVRGVKNFYSICQGIAAKIKRDANEKDLVIWLVDTTPGLESEIEQLKSEINLFYECGIKDLSMAVATIQNNIQFSLDSTNNPDKIIRYLDTLQYKKGVNAYKNRLLPLREVAKKYASFSGKKSIVYITLSPWENEDSLEKTVAILKQRKYSLYVVSQEAVFTDSYSITKNLRHSKFRFRGPESAADESMWSWITVPSGFYVNGHSKNTFFPSGFGFYGLSRLVYELDGWYYIYSPNRNNNSSEKSTGYSYYGLQNYRPLWKARSDYQRQLRKSKYKLIYKYWNDLASSKGISRYFSPYKISIQISERQKRVSKASNLANSFKSFSEIKIAVKAASTKINLIRSIKRKIESQTKKNVNQKNREYANLNLLYCDLLKSEFHLQQYLKLMVELHSLKKKLRKQFRKRESISISADIIGTFKTGLSSKAKLSRSEKKITNKMFEKLKSYQHLYKGTPWGYSIETGSLLTFKYKTIAAKPKSKPKKTKKKPKNNKTPKPKKPVEPTPPTRILINSGEGNSQTSGN